MNVTTLWMGIYNSVHDWLIQGVEIDSVIDVSVARSRVVSGGNIANISREIPIILFSSLLLMLSNFSLELESKIYIKSVR